MKKITVVLLFVFGVIFMPILTLSQPQGNGYETGDGDPDNVPPESVPFDSGVSLLVVFGIGYGIFKGVREMGNSE